MSHFFLNRPFSKRCLGYSLLLILLLAAQVQAQTLTWGSGAAGGSGTWNASNANWFNGSSNVVWPSGGNAIFNDPGGTVTISNFTPVVKSMTFNSPGYLIHGGSVKSSNSGLTVTTNADATIDSMISNSTSDGNFLIKAGSASLILTGNMSLSLVQVNAGELLTTSNFSSTELGLANMPSAILTLGQTNNSVFVKSLSGGGPLGGTVRPDSRARTMTLTLNGGTFGGTLKDNGSGKLALELQSKTNSTTLTNANTYTGNTSLQSSSLSLSGNGSVANSPFSMLGPECCRSITVHWQMPIGFPTRLRSRWKMASCS